MKILNLFLILSLALILFGCVTSESLLPEEARVKNSKVIGNYYSEGADRRRNDVRVENCSARGFDFQFNNGKGITRFNLYRVDELDLAFVESKSGEGNKRFIICRFSQSKTQIILEPMSSDFFKSNPGALPKTEIGGDVHTSASPAQLDSFFRLQGENRALFYTDRPMILNRVGT